MVCSWPPDSINATGLEPTHRDMKLISNLKTIQRLGLPLAMAALLAACGGSDPDTQARGAVIDAQLVLRMSRAEIDAGTTASGRQALTGTAQCDVDIRYVLYRTRDPKGEPATATTAVMVPSGSGANCSGDRPVLLNAHGTVTEKAYNIADVRNNEAGALLMAMFAAQGYIVVSPNYLGYDKSSLPYHPYMMAEADAIDMIDGLRAAKAYLTMLGTGTRPSTQLLVTGYSEGGYIAMATHKIIERDYAGEFTVTASGPMSGPYNWVKTLDTAFGAGPVPAGSTIFLPLILTGYQHAYGDMYKTPADAYQAPFAATAETLFPSDVSVATLVSQGKLPAADPAGIKLFGQGGLLTESFRNAVLTGGPARDRIRQNSLLGWTPKRPMALCGGELDPTAHFFNAIDAQADFASRNVTVPAYNFEKRATLPAGPQADALYAGFQAQKAAAGASALALYHGPLLRPYCSAAIRDFFQQVLTSGT